MKGKTSSKKMLIGHEARKLLSTKRSYMEILELLHNQFPDSNTTIGALRWYASKMRKEKKRVPIRERTTRGEG